MPGHRRGGAGLPQRLGGGDQRVVGGRGEGRERGARAGEAEQVERLRVAARGGALLDGGAEGGEAGGAGPRPGDGAVAREARAGLEGRFITRRRRARDGGSRGGCGGSVGAVGGGEGAELAGDGELQLHGRSAGI